MIFKNRTAMVTIKNSETVDKGLCFLNKKSFSDYVRKRFLKDHDVDLLKLQKHSVINMIQDHTSGNVMFYVVTLSVWNRFRYYIKEQMRRLTCKLKSRRPLRRPQL